MRDKFQIDESRRGIPLKNHHAFFDRMRNLQNHHSFLKNDLKFLAETLDKIKNGLQVEISG